MSATDRHERKKKTNCKLYMYSGFFFLNPQEMMNQVTNLDQAAGGNSRIPFPVLDSSISDGTNSDKDARKFARPQDVKLPNLVALGSADSDPDSVNDRLRSLHVEPNKGLAQYGTFVESRKQRNFSEREETYSVENIRFDAETKNNVEACISEVTIAEPLLKSVPSAEAVAEKPHERSQLFSKAELVGISFQKKVLL